MTFLRWVSFDVPSLVGEFLRFVSGDPEGNRFRVHYFRDDEKHLHARIWFGPETEGPPGRPRRLDCRGHGRGGAKAECLCITLPGR